MSSILKFFQRRYNTIKSHNDYLVSESHYDGINHWADMQDWCELVEWCELLEKPINITEISILEINNWFIELSIKNDLSQKISGWAKVIQAEKYATMFMFESPEKYTVTIKDCIKTISQETGQLEHVVGAELVLKSRPPNAR